MNKDVIYIDVDDDITAIIGKIKSAKEKIVALVPPKRTGALQSAVNLRLLERMAKIDNKKLVLITNNAALVALAANAQIPVAKNLQSKPELAQIPALIIDDGDDIIDGSELPVGDHANSIKVKDGTKPALADARNKAIDSTDIDIDGEDALASTATVAAARGVIKKPKSRAKIPNFDSFRKKLFLGIGGGIALIALLIWMFVFAPAATVIITASTAPEPMNVAVRLGGTAATDYKAGVISSVSQQDKKDETIEFDATGQKDVGEKATGTVRFTTDSISSLGTIPAGTQLRSTSGVVFTTDESVTLTIANARSGATTGITAADSGTNYNGASGSMSGAPSGVSANLVNATSGGTSQVVKVVSAADVERAQGQLVGESTDDEKKALIAKFTNDEVTIESSFTVERGSPVSSPAVDQEASSGKAKLTIPVTYTIQAVPRDDLDSYLKAVLEAKIDPATQKVYRTGIDGSTLSNFRKEGDASLATINATGSVGPEINETDIKEQVKGKRYGEVQQILQTIDGIKDVDVRFSYFWVRTVPNNTDKITIEFKVDEQ
ncbi:MAG: hypothetical protein WAR37_01135 [Candidatus Microsaccharimonas sp.]